MNFIRYIFTCSIILFLYSCFASMSMEFNSARTYARIEDNLVEAEKWALKAMQVEPENSAVPWFLANEVYRPQKKTDKVAEMFKEINGFGKVHPSTPIFCILYSDKS